LNEKFESGPYKVKLYEKDGFWNLEVMVDNIVKFGACHKNHNILKDDYDMFKSKMSLLVI